MACRALCLSRALPEIDPTASLEAHQPGEKKHLSHSDARRQEEQDHFSFMTMLGPYWWTRPSRLSSAAHCGVVGSIISRMRGGEVYSGWRSNAEQLCDRGARKHGLLVGLVGIGQPQPGSRSVGSRPSRALLDRLTFPLDRFWLPQSSTLPEGVKLTYLPSHRIPHRLVTG